MNDERPGGPIRIGDSEREDAVKRLGEHYEAGRISAEEHAERIDQALQAKTQDDLTALFADLPGEHQRKDETGEAWAGPWGWQRPPWTAPQNAAGPGGPGGPKRPDWAARGPFGKIPFPLLIALGVIGVLASIGCVVGGGHPPILPLALIVAAVVIVRKRRMERRA
ncbi:DUF1707 domain-containing protein [Kribbella sp. NPDC051952]|uniref:DUF1707 SHOCT-like domain-containing protein n=1 Tax=Kribbella sp. NPDC051952 TaxID=3154851 RepID=UPI00343A9F4C